MDVLEKNLVTLAQELHEDSSHMASVNAMSSAAAHYLAAERCMRFAYAKDAFQD